MSGIVENPWTRLRHFTGARLALGRAGDSLPTREVLEFGLAQAQARDAVHHPLHVESIQRELRSEGFETCAVQSAAQSRAEYLRRPDLGRKLNDASRALLASSLTSANDCHPERSEGSAFRTVANFDAVFIIADGLSAIAPERHAVPMLKEIAARLDGWKIAPVVISTQARVALGDEIGELLRAEMSIVLIGERPGLTSPDSLGIYLTCKPRTGCTDADRNCISNVRPEGLAYEAAANKLHYLMTMAQRLGRSGVSLKDDSDTALLQGGTP